MRDENIGHACRVHSHSGHRLRQLSGSRTEIGPRTSVEQQHAFARVHQQRLDTELEMIARRTGGLEYRSNLGRWLTDDEALAVIGLLYFSVLQRECAIAADLDRLDGATGRA